MDRLSFAFQKELSQHSQQDLECCCHFHQPIPSDFLCHRLYRHLEVQGYSPYFPNTICHWNGISFHPYANIQIFHHMHHHQVQTNHILSYQLHLPCEPIMCISPPPFTVTMYLSCMKAGIHKTKCNRST